jgi:hypothetical protein
LGGTRRRFEHGREHGKRGGLAGTIRAQEAEDLTLHDLEIDPVHGHEITKAPGQVCDVYCDCQI